MVLPYHELYKQRIESVLSEIKEFEKRATEVLEDLDKEGKFVMSTRKTGALQRQSMELSQALVELRKPRWWRVDGLRD